MLKLGFCKDVFGSIKWIFVFGMETEGERKVEIEYYPKPRLVAELFFSFLGGNGLGQTGAGEARDPRHGREADRAQGPGQANPRGTIPPDAVHYGAQGIEGEEGVGIGPHLHRPRWKGEWPALGNGRGAPP